MKPGIASCPPRSITLVEGPTKRATSASVPTKTILPADVAIACASGSRSSTVTMRPLRSTRSAGVCTAVWLVIRTPAATTMSSAVASVAVMDRVIAVKINPLRILLSSPDEPLGDEEVRHGQYGQRAGADVRRAKPVLLNERAHHGRARAEARVERGDDRTKRRAAARDRHVRDHVRRKRRIHQSEPGAKDDAGDHEHHGP